MGVYFTCALLTFKLILIAFFFSLAGTAFRYAEKNSFGVGNIHQYRNWRFEIYPRPFHFINFEIPICFAVDIFC